MNTWSKILLLAVVGVLLAGTLVAQQTIWACSNHNPQHVATSVQEMVALTQKFGCTGWHVLNR